MAFSETSRAVNAAKKQKGGVIKEVLDGVAALEKKKGNGKGKEIDVTITELAGQPVEEKVMVDGELPGMETEKDPELIRAGKSYNTAKKARMKLTITEVERKQLVMSLMHARGLKKYRYGKLTIELETTDKLKVSEDDDE